MSLADTDENLFVLTTTSDELADFIIKAYPSSLVGDRYTPQDRSARSPHQFSPLHSESLLEALQWYDSQHAEARHSYMVTSGDKNGEIVCFRINRQVYSDRTSVFQELQRIHRKRNR